MSPELIGFFIVVFIIVSAPFVLMALFYERFFEQSQWKLRRGLWRSMKSGLILDYDIRPGGAIYYFRNKEEEAELYIMLWTHSENMEYSIHTFRSCILTSGLDWPSRRLDHKIIQALLGFLTPEERSEILLSRDRSNILRDLLDPGDSLQ